MFRQGFSITAGAVSALFALALMSTPALAEGRGGFSFGGSSGISAGFGGYGGSSGGYGGYGNSWGGNEGYRGYGNSWGGNEGYRGYGNSWGGNEGYRGYGNSWGGYNTGAYNRYGYQPSYGYSYYPNAYNTQQYAPTYSTPSVQITVPNYTVTQSGYAQPAQPDNSAHVEVMVPSGDAQVFIDGNPTQQKGTDRLFVTPALDPGKTFHYDIQAQWMENGRQVERTRTVPITAGQTATADFTK